MNSPRRFAIPLLVVVLLPLLGAWYLLKEQPAADDQALAASGTVEAVEVIVSPETAGRVDEVFVQKGDIVKAGDALFHLDSQILDAQRQRAAAGLASAQAGERTARTGLEMAQAALTSAQAGLQAAQVGVQAAQLQADMALAAARASDAPNRTAAWKENQPSDFDQPVWYFDQQTEIAAAQAAADDAQAALDAERKNLDSTLAKASSADLLAAEKRLSEAQASYQVAQAVLDRAKAQSDAELRDYAQTLFDGTQDELEAAQSDYDKLLSDESSSDVLEARARLAVVQETYETALDRLNSLLTGENSRQVQASNLAVQQAQAGVAQAEAGVTQAKAGVEQAQAKLDQAGQAVTQAQAELDLLDVQLGKLTIYAGVDGVVQTRSIEPGEVVQPGAAALTLAQLDQLNITVYLPEDRYGQVALGDPAKVTVDSYPSESFDATVTRVADRAEFTPRNVQTEEGRRTTVYAVELSVSQGQGKLKPGMPADVEFNR